MSIEQEVQKAVDEVLNTNDWDIYKDMEDRGLEPAEYFEFVMAVVRKLERSIKIIRLEVVVLAAAVKFREYESLHAAKGSLDGDVKARANAEMAEMLEKELGLKK